jgi:hypothetical protein
MRSKLNDRVMSRPGFRQQFAREFRAQVCAAVCRKSTCRLSRDVALHKMQGPRTVGFVTALIPGEQQKMWQEGTMVESNATSSCGLIEASNADWVLDRVGDSYDA